jgi:hypothetical protein
MPGKKNIVKKPRPNTKPSMSGNKRAEKWTLEKTIVLFQKIWEKASEIYPETKTKDIVVGNPIITLEHVLLLLDETPPDRNYIKDIYERHKSNEVVSLLYSKIKTIFEQRLLYKGFKYPVMTKFILVNHYGYSPDKVIQEIDNTVDLSKIVELLRQT